MTSLSSNDKGSRFQKRYAGSCVDRFALSPFSSCLNQSFVDTYSAAGFFTELRSVTQEPGSIVRVSTEGIHFTTLSAESDKSVSDRTCYGSLENHGCQLKYEILDSTGFQLLHDECRLLLKSYCGKIEAKNIEDTNFGYLEFDVDINILERGRVSMIIPKNAWTQQNVDLLSVGMKIAEAEKRMLFCVPTWLLPLQTIVLNLDPSSTEQFMLQCGENAYVHFKYCRIWYRKRSPEVQSLNFRYYTVPDDTMLET
jgi:hypothetical protein